MDDVYLIEKFTRCPGCASFSLRGTDPEGKRFECANCNEEFLLKDNQLKNVNGSKKQKQQPAYEPEPVPPPEPVRRTEPPRVEEVYAYEHDEPFEPLPPREKSSKKFILLAIPILAAAAIVLFFILQGNDKPPEPTPEPVKKPVVIPVPKKETPPVTETKKEEPTKLPTKQPATNNETPPPTGTEAPGEEKKEPAVTQPEKQPEQLPETKKEEPAPEPVTEKKPEPWSRFIFKPTLVKVRSRFPDTSDSRNRWYFKRFKLTVKRAASQRVYIAGGPDGKKKWAVDDVIIINGKRIDGCKEKMDTTGAIPHSKRLPPLDITHMVKPDRNVQLNLKLADYGEYWGNTAIYIVIK